MVNKLMFGLIFGILLIGMVSATITVTLNAPADLSTQLNQNISINISALVPNGENLTSLTLYTNSSGTFTNRSTVAFANYTVNNPDSATNPTNFFDNNDATYAQKTGDPSTTASLGQDFSSRYIGNVRIKAVATTTTGADSPSTSVILQKYNGTVWSTVGTLASGTTSASYDNTYALNSEVSGLRIQLNGGAGAGSSQDHKFYTLEYNSTVSQLFNATVAVGTNLWNVEGCNSGGTCTFATSNRTFNVANITLNSFSHNLTSYETAYESYVANISGGTGLTAVALNYNGTEYSMSQSGSLWTYSKYITSSNIGNNTINFTSTYQGVNLTSSNVYQNVSSANISACNGVYTTKYINFSFIDEATGLPVNAQITSLILNYKLSSASTVFKTLTYSNTTEAPNYYFCAIPSDKTYYLNYTIAYKNGSSSSSPFYPQRVSEISTTAFTNVTTNTTLYLLNDGTGIYVTFQVTNQADQLLSGVSVNATRIVGSSNVTVAAGTTSAAGTVTFWLNPDALHTFTFAKAGYTTYVYSDYPTQASYTVSLSGGGDSTLPISYSKGMNYNIFPTNSSLTNDTTYTFGFKLTSSYWTLQEYGFVLRFDNGTSITSSTSSISGTLLSMSYNTGNTSDKVFLDYYWKVNNTYTNGTIDWRIYSTDNTRWSIRTFFDDFNAYFDSGLFGLDNFGRYLIVFLILFLSVGIMAYKYGFTDPLFLTGLLFFVVMFLDVGIGIIPDITIMNGNAVPHLLTFITGLIFVVSIISEVSKR